MNGLSLCECCGFSSFSGIGAGCVIGVVTGVVAGRVGLVIGKGTIRYFLYRIIWILHVY